MRGGETDLEQNVREAELALTEKPLFASSVERIRIFNELKSEYKDLPQPLRLAKFLTILLERVSVPLEKWDLIAGRCVDRELTSQEEEMFQALLGDPDYPGREVLLDSGSGHCSFSWDMVVRLGLPGLKEQALHNLEACQNEEERIFLTAIIQIYDGIRAYLLRYAWAAEEMGMTGLAANLEKAATRKPDSFVVALQLLWGITLIDCAYVTPNPTLTLGRMDRILYPLYQKDISEGKLTAEEAARYITDYYCKHNLIMGRGEHQVGDGSNSTTFLRIFNFDAPQYLLLGGVDESGADAANELTTLFVRCIRPKFKNPVVVVYYSKEMNLRHPELWKTLTEKAMESASLMFYNDSNIRATFWRIGLPEEDYRSYIHFGCNWPSPGDEAAGMHFVPDSSHFHAYFSEEEEKALRIPYFSDLYHNSACGWPEDFMAVLHALARREEDVTIEDFYRMFFDRMEAFIDRKLAHLSRELAVRKRRPSAVLTFGDCFLKDAVENGQSFSACAKYHFELQPFQMFGTVADCFIAVDQLVMREKKLTLKELTEAVDANFEGYPGILALCRGAEKYGMDTELSNAHVERLSETASRIAIEKSRPYLAKEKLFLAPCMQCDTWHLKLGELFGATPDGRLAHTSFSQNIAPSAGACVNGMTAMLNAISHLPGDGLLSGALNLDVDPKQFEGKRELFSALLATYFNQGGLHAQVSAASLEDLIDAQKRPQLHRDLRVRVTGYSGVFVDICKRLQDDIIRRFERGGSV